MSCSFPELSCALCNQPIDPPEELFRASGDFLPPKDPLTPYCNAPMHWSCYAQWPHRKRFARLFVDAWVEANRKNPFWWSVHRDENVYISINPGRGVEEASLRLYAFGNDIRVSLPRWHDWLENLSDGAAIPLHSYERKVLQDLLPMLRERFPDDHALVDAIDPEEKRPARRARAGSTQCT